MVWQNKLIFLLQDTILWWVWTAHLTEAFVKKNAFAIQGVLTLNCFRHSKNEQLEETKGRQRNVCCELPQAAWAAQNEGKPSPAYEEERQKYRSLTEVEALDYFQEFCITCWLTLCLLSVCPWTLAPGFLPHSGTTAPKQLHQSLQCSPLCRHRQSRRGMPGHPAPVTGQKKGSAGNI